MRPKNEFISFSACTLRHFPMYKTTDYDYEQLSFTNFNTTCGMQLDQNNEWIKLAKQLPWKAWEPLYQAMFPSGTGNVAKSARMVLGSLILQQRMGFTDRGLVDQIQQNPYYQYFIGLDAFQHTEPFSRTLLVEWRKRVDLQFIIRANDILCDAAPKAFNFRKRGGNTNRGTLIATQICDATVAPQYIRFPQDTSLLNEARVKLEAMIDFFCERYGLEKPRTYRKVAHKDYLTFARSKKPAAEKISEAVKAQLGYVRRDLAYVEGFMHQGYAPLMKQVDNYITIHALYQQQQYMFDNKTHKVENRIVSISQPYVRPIVRGKTKAPTEFGAKLHLSVDENGFGRIESLSFNAFNEGPMLIEALNAYKYRNHCFPERVLVDQIYRTRANIRFCKENDIRINGPKLGRPAKDPTTIQKDRKTANQDNMDRIEIERYFSTAKRRNGMGLINKKREDTSLSVIAMSVMVTNIFGSFKSAIEEYDLKIKSSSKRSRSTSNQADAG